MKLTIKSWIEIDVMDGKMGVGNELGIEQVMARH